MFCNCKTQLKKLMAFTLAETLIVIGIIGVVASLTIPNLNSTTADKEKVTKVKKIYSQLNEAFERAQAVYGPIEEWFQDAGSMTDEDRSTRFAERMTEFMKLSKVCKSDAGCFSSAPLLETDGTTMYDDYLADKQNSSQYMVITADGMSVGFDLQAHIYVDIDGPSKGKNQEGNDIFTFGIDPNGNLSPEAGHPMDGEDDEHGLNYSTTWVIQNGNLDYLKCPDDISWNGQTSCK